MNSIFIQNEILELQQ